MLIGQSVFEYNPRTFDHFFPQKANVQVGLLFIDSSSITLKEGILLLQPMYCNTGYWLFEQTDQIFYLLNERNQSQRRTLMNKTLFLLFCFGSLAVCKCHISPEVSGIAWDNVVTGPFCVYFCHFVCHTPHTFFTILLLWLVQSRQMCFYQF